MASIFKLQDMFVVVLTAALLIASLISSAAAQTDRVSVFADVSGSACSIADESESVFTVYVIHHYADCTLTVDMSVIEGNGFGATYLSESIPFIHWGDFRGGVSIFYEWGKYGTVLIGTMQYQGHGTSVPCSRLDTSESPRFPYPTVHAIVQDCIFQLDPAPSLGALYVNPSPACGGGCAVATEPVTWGAVKALYR